MKTQLLCVITLLVAFAKCNDELQQEVIDSGIATTATSTESDPLISSLQNIVNKVKSMKERVEKTLNDTVSSSTVDMLEKSHHDFLIARGYTFTSDVGYHKLYLTELTWKEALHRCSMEKAHLAVIDSLAERKALGDLMKSRLAMLQGVHSLKAYVGIHDYCKNGSWITIFFDVLDNAKHIQWKDGSSEYTSQTKGSGPKCAIIDDEEYLSDVKCIKKQPFICEMEAP